MSEATSKGPLGPEVLAKMNDQTPLVMERSIGEGKVIAFASTFDNVSNDLPIHASWVPFVTQTAMYLGGGGADKTAKREREGERKADHAGGRIMSGPAMSTALLRVAGDDRFTISGWTL